MEQTQKQVKPVAVRDVVVYVDPHGKERLALVTAVWPGEYGTTTGVNVVFVSDDTSKQDSYGQQIERMTSVCHTSVQPARGNYWKHIDE